MNLTASPLIGLTVYNADDKFHYYPNDYINSVRIMGGIPVLMPPGETNLVKLVDTLDGIILTGGGDINPDRYHQQPHPQLYWVNEDQDAHEFAIAERALDLKKPLLATCRGMQVVNILLGGSLHQHLPDQYGDTVPHRTSDNQAVEHQVRLDGDCKLADLLGNAEFTVKSWHHQCVNELAPGFRAVGLSADGVIEAIESDAYPDLIAVQWHPEIDNANHTVQQSIFKSWLDKCSKPVI